MKRLKRKTPLTEKGACSASEPDLLPFSPAWQHELELARELYEIDSDLEEAMFSLFQ